MKKTYTKPNMEITSLKSENVIATLTSDVVQSNITALKYSNIKDY